MRIGIDVGGSKIEGIGLDDDGSECVRQRIPAPQDVYSETIEAVVEVVRSLEAESGQTAATVGVGIPGALSPATGLVKNANSTWLIGKPFDRDLENALDRPTRVANDANCFAVSEAVDGAASDAQIVFGVIIGTGVGAGIAINGQLLEGRNAIAGEWGHNPLPWPTDEERPGTPCYCGRSGCIETFLSGPALTADHKTASGTQARPREIVDMATAGDPVAEKTLRRYEGRLARALASVINVLDPDVIVLGGGLSNVDRLYHTVPAHWGPYVFSDHVATDLRPPRHGDSSGVRAAARLWPINGEI